MTYEQFKKEIKISYNEVSGKLQKQLEVKIPKLILYEGKADSYYARCNDIVSYKGKVIRADNIEFNVNAFIKSYDIDGEYIMKEIVKTICHEIAHLTEVRHNKKHEALTNKYLSDLIK